jgi:cystathionine beta-lyase family protein involved in aluminum resistance
MVLQATVAFRVGKTVLLQHGLQFSGLKRIKGHTKRAPLKMNDNFRENTRIGDLHPAIERGINALQSTFAAIDRRTLHHMNKIIQYYGEERVDSQSFHGVNGYGHGDLGREQYDNILAKLCGAEAAYVRLQFFSGTHAISTALFASLRPGDQMLCVSGKPYDTLEEVIGLRKNEQTDSLIGSLKDWGIEYKEIALLYADEVHPSQVSSGTSMVASSPLSGVFDFESIAKELDSNPAIKLLHIQRSCGYQWRPSISIEQIKGLVDFIDEKYKKKGRDIIVFVDNCYGELVENREPTHVGADLMAGSLIKNFGGTLAPSGGYVVGRRDLVNRARVHLSAPGVDGGATFNQYRNLFQVSFLCA